MPLTTLRLDPWSPMYESAVKLDEDEDADQPAVKLDVETDRWAPVSPPQPSPYPEAVFFIDGVRRVDTGLLDERDGVITYGVMGSLAAGVTMHADSRASIYAEEVQRRLVLGPGLNEPVSMSVPAGQLMLDYRFAEASENTRARALAQVQIQMRTLEGELARRTTERATLTFIDGPLTYLLPLEEPILGYVKTHSRYYVTGEHLRVVTQLTPGARTPVFQFGASGASRYSWYTCVGPRRLLDHSLAGVVRVEVSAVIGASEAVRLADLSTAILPRFATTPAWDPRAPQNLYPVSALESRLHHRLGDREFIRRSIAVHFHKLVAA